VALVAGEDPLLLVEEVGAAAGAALRVEDPQVEGEGGDGAVPGVAVGVVGGAACALEEFGA